MPPPLRGLRCPAWSGPPAFLDTANAEVAGQLLIRAGMFDEGFPGSGWEDFDIGVRLRTLGVRRVFCRQAVVFHIEPFLRAEPFDALF